VFWAISMEIDALISIEIAHVQDPKNRADQANFPTSQRFR
jgi:hypothetical protein